MEDFVEQCVDPFLRARGNTQVVIEESPNPIPV